MITRAQSVTSREIKNSGGVGVTNWRIIIEKRNMLVSAKIAAAKAWSMPVMGI